jgi:molecular chaperone GrpE (heat shock protein)
MNVDNLTDPYKNTPKDLSDQDLWDSLNRRIEKIDEIRRSIRSQRNQATANNDKQKLNELSAEANMLIKERFAIHNEMKLIKQRIKKGRRNQQRSSARESLAIEFMLIAQKKLPQTVYDDIRNEAAMNIACQKK